MSTTTPASPPPAVDTHALRNPTRAAAVLGAALFLLGTALHPARHGHGVAAAGDLYGYTHGIQAVGLLLQVLAYAGLAGVAGQSARRARSLGAAAIGTLLWFGLIVYDGAVNPVLAQHLPDAVHAGGELDPMGMVIVLPALLAFPVGHLLVARAHWSTRLRTSTAAIAAGAWLYMLGGLLIFGAGPEFDLIQPLETLGATVHTLGLIVLARNADQAGFNAPLQRV